MPLIPRNESDARLPIRPFTIRAQPRRRVNVHGNGNNSGNAMRQATRRANLERTRQSLNRNRNAREFAAVQARVAEMRAQNNAELAGQVRAWANNFSNRNASQSRARRYLKSLAQNPAALRRLSVAVLLTLFVAAGQAMRAMTAIQRNRGNAKEALFKVAQKF